MTNAALDSTIRGTKRRATGLVSRIVFALALAGAIGGSAADHSLAQDGSLAQDATLGQDASLEEASRASPPAPRSELPVAQPLVPAARPTLPVAEPNLSVAPPTHPLSPTTHRVSTSTQPVARATHPISPSTRPVARLTLPAARASLVLAQAAPRGGAVEDLLEAVEAGRVTVAATAVSPESLRLTASNPSDERRRLKLSGVFVAVPRGDAARRANEPAPGEFTPPNGATDRSGTPGEEPIPEFQRPSGEAPSNEALQRSSQEVVETQTLWVGAVDGRGGLAGEQIVELAPGQIKEIDLPTLRTKLERFRPLEGASYRVARPARWTRDAELLGLADQIGRFGACRGAAQAALWKLTLGASLKQLRMIKPRDVNDAEVVLAEHLLAVARDPNRESPALPAKAFVRVINRSGEEGLDLTDELRRVVDRGGLFGLPVELQAIDEARLDSPSAIALALGCQWTIQKAPAAPNTPTASYQAQILLRWWDGRTFEPRRQFDVFLGPTPAPADAVSLAEQGVLRHLLRIEPIDPAGGLLGASEPKRLRIVNSFPYSLHAATLRGAADSPDAGATWTLRGLAIGPGRSLEIPFDGPVDRLQVVAAAWGH